MPVAQWFRRRLTGTGALAVLLLGGCSAPLQRPATGPLPPVSSGRQSDTAVPAEEPAGPGAEIPAAVALLEQSRSQSAAGDFGSAAVTVERALSIDPNSPALWIELAEIRWRQGDLDQADALARKALTLAGSDRSIAERASRLTRRR